MVRSFLKHLRQRYEADLPEAAQEYIDFAVDGAQRMTQLIEALLAYARIDAQGKEPTPTDAEGVLQLVLRNLVLRIEDTGAEITHDSLPTVLVDPTQLLQLFQNLISNALKFRREDVPPRIHISATFQPSPLLKLGMGKSDGGVWRFSVQDNGIGIPPDQTDSLFQVFKRLHNRDEYEGSGIGLATCKKIVERHGGRIWVESEEGKGTTFYFTLSQAL